jgi:hypothetical protein
MVYRAPGSYVRFVKKVKPKNTNETTRIMALVGTGSDYYEVYNEAVSRNSNSGYDILANEDIEKIYSVSSKPILTNKNIADYKDVTHYGLRQGKYINWVPSLPATAILEKGLTASGVLMSDAVFDLFKNEIHVAIDTSVGNNSFLIKDGTFKITVTKVDLSTGTVSIMNVNTGEILNSTVQANRNNIREFSVIGINVSIDTTLIAGLSEGDSVIIKTTAPLTQQNATAIVDINSPSTSLEWADLITSTLKIVNQSLVQTQTYELELQNVAAGIFDIKILGATEILFTGTIGLEKEYIGIIPGVSFELSALHVGALIHDKVIIETVAAKKGDAPIDQSVYYVSYKYKKTDADRQPKIFYEYEDIIKEYGQYEVSNSAGVVKNSLVLAAEIALQAGIAPLVCVQTKDNTDVAFFDAMDLLKRPISGLKNVNVIIPLTTSPIVGGYVKKHVLEMSDTDNGKERMAYLSSAINQKISKEKTTFDTSIGMVETAKEYNEERIVFVVPGEITKEIVNLNTGKTYDALLPACFAAVGVACMSLSNDPADPITNKVLTGFKALPQAMLESEKKLLSAAGCLVLEQDAYVIKVRHGVTTATFDPTIIPGVNIDNSASVEQMEITLVQIKDYVADLSRVATAKFIGTKNKATSVAEVEETISTLLNSLITREIIIGAEGLVVRRSKNDPREIEVSFDIEAVYPLNYITISFGFAI